MSETYKLILNEQALREYIEWLPDLNDSMSAIAFILPEDIYNCELDEYTAHWHPDYHDKEVHDYIRKFRLASN